MFLDGRESLGKYLKICVVTILSYVVVVHNSSLNSLLKYFLYQEIKDCEGRTQEIVIVQIGRKAK